MPVPNEPIGGTCQRPLFSPKGGIDGALIKVRRAGLGAAGDLRMTSGDAAVAG
jgi:hypothetical protein